MKEKYEKRSGWYRTVLLLMALCVWGSCSDGNNGGEDSGNAVFDPNKPVVVEDINPKTGGAGQRLVIMGDNFGNDPSLVNVYVSGKKAVVINVKSNAIYCFMPEGAYTGEIEVRITVGDEQEVLAEIAPGLKFDYQKKMLVSTLLGTRRDDGQYDSKDGPFNDCGALGAPNWMEFDPKYKHLIYIAQDAAGGDENEGGGNMRVIDLKNEYLGTALTDGNIHGNRRGRSVNFFDDNHMAVAVDQGDELRAAVYGYTRTKEPPQSYAPGESPNYEMWGNKVTLVKYKQCNTVAFHPVHHDMYFNSYEKGQFFRADHEKIQEIFDGVRPDGLEAKKDCEELFQMDNGWEYNIRMHPTGNYAYIVAINQHYIQRTNYDWERHTFLAPYVVAGEARTANYVNAIGTSARFSTPYQGVFVKNPAYAGEEDEYDFVICDKLNQCLRIITPQGEVSLFAGRGSSSLNNNPWGYIDGDLLQEARFDRPKGLAYDEENGIFYVGDGSNRRIRKIAKEGE